MCKLTLFIIATVTQVIIQHPKLITALPLGDSGYVEDNEINRKEVQDNEVNPVILLEAGGKKFLISNSPTVEFKQLYIPKVISKKKQHQQKKLYYDNYKKKSITTKNIKKPTPDIPLNLLAETSEKNTIPGEIIASKIHHNSDDVNNADSVTSEAPEIPATIVTTTEFAVVTEEECETTEPSAPPEILTTPLSGGEVATTQTATTVLPLTTTEVLTTTENCDIPTIKKYEKQTNNSKKPVDTLKKLRSNQNSIKMLPSKLQLVQKRNTNGESNEDNEILALPVTVKPKSKMTLAERLENETSVERAERIHRGFQRMIQFVNIVGQVDQYLSSKARSAVRKLALLYDEDDAYDRRNSRRHAKY